MMGIELTDFIWHLVNIGVVYIVLRLLLYKPAVKFIRAREEKLRTRVTEIQNNAEEVLASEKQVRQMMAEANDKAAGIVQSSSVAAEARAQDILEEAQAKAKEYKEEARREIEHERKLAMDSLRAEIAQASLDLAGKVLEREVSYDDNEKLIQDFIKKVG